jgi:hypothetical protein
MSGDLPGGPRSVKKTVRGLSLSSDQLPWVPGPSGGKAITGENVRGLCTERKVRHTVVRAEKGRRCPLYKCEPFTASLSLSIFFLQDPSHRGPSELKL